MQFTDSSSSHFYNTFPLVCFECLKIQIYVKNLWTTFERRDSGPSQSCEASGREKASRLSVFSKNLPEDFQFENQSVEWEDLLTATLLLNSTTGLASGDVGSLENSWHESIRRNFVSPRGKKSCILFVFYALRLVWVLVHASTESVGRSHAETADWTSVAVAVEVQSGSW